MSEKQQAIAAELDELASRGFGHPDGQAIMGRVRVTLQQLADEAAGQVQTLPPLDARVAEIGNVVAGLAAEVPKVLQRQADVVAEVAGLAGPLQALRESVDNLAAEVVALGGLVRARP